MKKAVSFMKRRHIHLIPYLIFFSVLCLFRLSAETLIYAQSDFELTDPGSSGKPIPPPTLVHAAMCEKIKDYAPLNEAVVFSISTGSVSCFSSFDQISEKMFIYHNWYRQDRLMAKKRLTLNPPRWATFSSMQLREADKGPWRVEITRADGTLVKILRFSITD